MCDTHGLHAIYDTNPQPLVRLRALRNQKKCCKSSPTLGKHVACDGVRHVARETFKNTICVRSGGHTRRESARARARLGACPAICCTDLLMCMLYTPWSHQCVFWGMACIWLRNMASTWRAMRAWRVCVRHIPKLIGLYTYFPVPCNMKLCAVALH